MAQIRNRLEIQDSIRNEQLGSIKKLPRFFDETDEIKLFEGLSMSVGVHIVLIILFIALGTIQKVMFPHLPQPKLQEQDIEFKLVQNESQKPINKKTKIRSDRDSRAGGKHDPKRAISQPSPKPAPAKKKVAQAPAKQQKQAPAQNIFKQLTKPKQAPAPAKAPIKAPSAPKQSQQAPIAAKPAPIKAPGAKIPNVKPTVKPSVSAPTAPKIASAPTSPFKVAVPPTKAPVGSTYRPQTSGNNASSVSGGSSSSGSNLAPKFSSSGSSGSKTGSRASSGGGSSYASRGSSGGGNYGNPSPGNPNGAPGIDAIRQPNWGPYMRDLEQKIKRNWSPPKGDTSKRVVITFTIAKDGRLLSHRVTKSSGVPLADRAAMNAIELTAPFRPLPPEFKGQSVPIEFTFDYNVLNSVLK